MTGRAWIDQLPAELDGQKAIMRRLLAVCESDDRISWLMIGCSLGRGNADRLSDLDMALGVRDEDFDAAIGDVRAACDGLADLVESYHHQLPGLTVRHERIFAQYADRCQLDLVVFPASYDVSKAPSPVILYDRDNQIVPSDERPPVTGEQVREWAFRGWCVLADFGKYLRRGSLWEALECLHEARANLWRLLAVAEAVPDARYGVTSILDFAPARVPAGMAGTVAELDRARLLAAAQRLARLLTAIGERLPAPLRDDLPDAMAAFVTADLEELAVATAPADTSPVPQDCTLPTAEQPLRAAEFADLFAGSVLAAGRPEPTRLRLELRRDPVLAGRAAELAAVETDCCSFFTFALTVGNDSLALDVSVPPSRAGVLDGLADRVTGGMTESAHGNRSGPQAAARRAR
jgi:hypothetical protein